MASARADGIDVLLSFCGRLDDNRPMVCAHRAAPVQISVGDLGTSGLETMDYILLDPVLAPRGGPERFGERVLRLPGLFYGEPPRDAPE